MTDDGKVVSLLLGCIVTLLGIIRHNDQRDLRNLAKEMRLLRANFHNFTRSSFVLLSRLHPKDGPLIAEAQADYYQGRDTEHTNGKAHHG